MRAAPGGTISEQNCHPFVHGGWMFQHNGEVPAFSALKRELTLEVDPALYPRSSAMLILKSASILR